MKETDQNSAPEVLDDLDDDFQNEVQAEDITLFDLAVASGFSEEWAEQEILFSTAMMGLLALEQEGHGAKTARFTLNVGEDMPVEITVRLQEERFKKRLH